MLVDYTTAVLQVKGVMQDLSYNSNTGIRRLGGLIDLKSKVFNRSTAS